MAVIDSGRTDDFDFSMQSSNHACKYDVGWRVLKLRLHAEDPEELTYAIAIAKAYINGAENMGKFMRLIRVRTWINGHVLAYLPLRMALLVSEYKDEVAMDYRELGRELGLVKPDCSGEMDLTKMPWDWHPVRLALRHLFATDPLRFIDIRKDVQYNHNAPGFHSERNYFIMLCDEDTYVRGAGTV